MRAPGSRSIPPPKSNPQTPPGHCFCSSSSSSAAARSSADERARPPYGHGGPPQGSAAAREHRPAAPAGGRGRRGGAGACAGGGRAAAADPAHEPHLLGAVRRVAGVPDAAVAGEDPRLHAAPRRLPRRDLRHLRPRRVAHLPPQLLRDRLRAVRRLQQRRRGGLHHRLPPQAGAGAAAAARAGAGPVLPAGEPRRRPRENAGGGRGDRGRGCVREDPVLRARD